MQSGSGCVQSMSGWKKLGAQTLCGYMEWLLVGTEMAGWHVSDYLPSECLFVCAQIKQGDNRGCREYR